MAIIKINDENYKTLKTSITTCQKKMEETIELWKADFSQSFNSFDDYLKSEASKIESSLSSVASKYLICRGSDISTLNASAISDDSALIKLALNALGLNEYWTIKKDLKIDINNVNKFLTLLSGCNDGSSENYQKLIVIQNKITSIFKSLEKITAKINEFQTSNRITEAILNKAGLKGTFSDDGITLNGINTEVTINGEKVELTISEAMNAFYTYESTVMSAELQADYIKNTYNVNVEYQDIVNNANGFMKNTIESDLYTNQFITNVLKEYTPIPDQESLITAAAGKYGITAEDYKSVLEQDQIKSIFGDGIALLGAAFIGKATQAATSLAGGTSSSSPSSSGGHSSSGGGGYSSGGGHSSGGGYSSGGGAPASAGAAGGAAATAAKAKAKDEDDETNKKKKALDKKDKENEKLSELEEISKIGKDTIDKLFDSSTPESIIEDFPNKIKVEITKDYDEIARNKYESQSLDELNQYRAELTAEINNAFDSGNIDSLKERLKGYGYSDTDIEKIVTDRDTLLTAIISGDQKEKLSELANTAATNDKVENFDTAYDDQPSYEKLIDGTESTLIVNTKTDAKVSSAKTTLDASLTEYRQTVKETNTILSQLNDKKSRLENLYEKYTTKNGFDTSKWKNSQIEAYEKAVTSYKNLADEAQNQLNKVESAKAYYQQSLKNYETIKSDFLLDIKNQNDKSNLFNGIQSNETTNVISENNTIPSGEQIGTTDGNTISLSDQDAISSLNQNNTISFDDSDALNLMNQNNEGISN